MLYILPMQISLLTKKDQRKSRVVESTKLKHKRLRKNAIPSIWPNCPHYLSSPVALRPTPSTTTEARQAKQDSIIEARIEEEHAKDAFHSLEEMDAKDHSLPDDIIKFKETEKISYLSICMAEKPNVRYCLKVYKTMEFEMWCAGIKLNTNSLKRNNLDNAGNYLKSSSQLQSILNLLKIQYSQNIEQEDLIEAVIDKLEDPRVSSNKKIGFISEQLHLLNSAPKGRRYSSSLLSMCCILYRTSPACYKQIINDDILTVPGERNPRLISSALHMDLSLDESTIAYLKARFSKLSEKDKYVALLMDEVHCNQSVHYVNGKFYVIENGEITKTLLCVMVKYVAGNYRDVISMNTIVNINAE